VEAAGPPRAKIWQHARLRFSFRFLLPFLFIYFTCLKKSLQTQHKRSSQVVGTSPTVAFLRKYLLARVVKWGFLCVADTLVGYATRTVVSVIIDCAYLFTPHVGLFTLYVCRPYSCHEKSVHTVSGVNSLHI
jgi:hypothetical protein